MVKESGHWYDQSGAQISEVPGAKKGTMVEPDLRHAKKFGLARGVTSIIANAARHNLVAWQIEQAIIAAMESPKREFETDKDYLDRIKLAAKDVAKRAADAGSKIHGAIEAHFRGQDYDPEMEPYVVGALGALSNIGDIPWRTEVGVASPLGYGTKIDLVAPPYLGDIKTKNGTAEAMASIPIRRNSYEQYPMQLAAGADAWAACGGAPIERHFILFVSRTAVTDGVADAIVHWIDPELVEAGRRMFRMLLEYTFEKDGYRPAWGQEK